MAVVLAIFTFPSTYWVYGEGIDEALPYAFNLIATQNFSIGQHIIFPHGPLAFLTYPLAPNVEVYLAVLLLLKILLVLALAELVQTSKAKKWLLIFGSAYLLCVLTDFVHLTLAVCLAAGCAYYKTQKVFYKIVLFLLSAVAFYVKSYVAVLSGTLVVALLLYELFTVKSVKRFFVESSAVLLAIFCIWILLYQSPNGFFRYVVGVSQLIGDNSAAAAFYPENNWAALFGCFLCLIFLYFKKGSNMHVFYASFTLFSLFAAWKHGMAREDIVHIQSFFIYLISVLLVFLLLLKTPTAKQFLLGLGILFLFQVSTNSAKLYNDQRYQVLGINNFLSFFTEYQKTNQINTEQSKRLSQINKLSPALLQQIGQAKVDVYPWDYSVLGVNQLNWQPRVVLHSYAAYTSWLDRQDSAHFASAKAPNYLLWQRYRLGKNLNQGTFTSIDQRYMFNDEPQTILSLLKHYTFSSSDENFLLLKKRRQPLELKPVNFKQQKTTWGKWIQTPKGNYSLLRVKAIFEKSLLLKLKSFLYKDEQVWMYLKMSNGFTHKYKIVPKNATDGLWVAPYFFDQSNEQTALKVTAVSFIASNKYLAKPEIKLTWQAFNSEGEVQAPQQLLNKLCTKMATIYINTVNHFDQKAKGWSTIAPEHLQKDGGIQNSACQIVNAENWSTQYTQSLDSLPTGNLQIKAEAWFKGKGETKGWDKPILMVIEHIDGAGNQLEWWSADLNWHIIDVASWNAAFAAHNINHKQLGELLRVSIWNTSKRPVYIDDFRIAVQSPSL